VLTLVRVIHRRRFPRLPLPVLSLVMSFINPPTCCLIEGNTSFPSEVKDNRIYGGALLVQIDKSKENDRQLSSENILLKLRVTFTDRGGKEQGNEIIQSFSNQNGDQKDYYSSAAVKKAVLLQRYVYAIQQFLIAYHKKEDTQRPRARLIAYSRIFTLEANESGDEELKKAAKECENFARNHCLSENEL